MLRKLSKFMAFALVFVLLASALVVFVPEEASASTAEPTIPEGAFGPCMVIGKTGYITWNLGCYVAGNNVLDYDRIMLLAFDLANEIGGKNIEITDLNITAKRLNAGPALTIDVYPVPAFEIEEDGIKEQNFDDTFINTYLPNGYESFNLKTLTTIPTPGWAQGNGFNETWQEQYDEDGHIYIGIAGWSFEGTAETFRFDITNISLAVTYEVIPSKWSPTITSSSSGNDTVCFMDPYVYEMSANESCTWTIDSITPPAGGSAEWLDIIAGNGTLFGVPFPICGPDGIGEYEVSVKATSTKGTLSSYQNFTLTVTADRSGFDLYETFGDLVIDTTGASMLMS